MYPYDGLSVTGSQVFPAFFVTQSGGSFTLDSQFHRDYHVAFNLSGGASCTFHIPAASDMPGRRIRITDYGQNLATNNVVVTPASGTVAGGSTATLNTSKGVWELWADSSSNWVAEKIGTVGV
jgi:hypothetical protein